MDPRDPVVVLLAQSAGQAITRDWEVTTMEPYLLSEPDAEAAGELFATAFLPSAVATFLFPDPMRRSLLLPAFFTAMSRLAVRHGEAVALGAPLQAVALWLFPDREPPTEEDFAEAGMGAFASQMDAAEAERLASLNSHLDAAHERVMDRPHWYLPFLAVSPGYQRQGAGTLLMRHTLDRAISTGMPCYLDSSDEQNLPFYERLGFRVMEDGVVPGSELRLWSMRRG
jgi:ribosomal protein S18 acetylase RimI-like enzyme